MKNILVFIALVMLAVIDARSQSFEFMDGSERIFVDVQWLETFDEEQKWSLFSRTRATAEDRENTNLFTGAYLNYTSSSGFGGTNFRSHNDCLCATVDRKLLQNC